VSWEKGEITKKLRYVNIQKSNKFGTYYIPKRLSTIPRIPYGILEMLETIYKIFYIIE